MKLFTEAHSCLLEILDKKTPFRLAIDNACSKNTTFREDRKNLYSIIGCSLRHFYIFDYLINKVNEEFIIEQKVALYLFLSNYLFVPIVGSEETESFLNELNISNSDVEKLKELCADKTKLIPTEYKNNSIEYLHYRFNIPSWVLKMWMKHYKGNIYRIAKTINKPVNHYAILNEYKLSKDDLIQKYPEIKTTQFDGLYLYDGNVPPRKHSLFRSGTLVGISPAEYHLLNSLDLDPLRKIAVYSEIYLDLQNQLIAILGNKYQMDYIAGSSESYYPTKKDLERTNLNKVNLYECNHSSIITCLSEKVHTFFVSPKNSNFAEFRKSPDYFNRLEQSELDGIIENQLNALLSAADFVEDDGLLIYVIPTMDKKETERTISNFLKSRPDYSLVEQHQFLPFDKYDSILFISILKKVEATND